MAPVVVFTVGHSTRTIEEFVHLFRGYTDYMDTSPFKQALDRCVALAQEERVVLMCAEAVPWRCHRSLIADALLARGIEVRELASAMHARPYSLTSWARISGARVTYPPAGFETEQVTSARMGNGRPVPG